MRTKKAFQKATSKLKKRVLNQMMKALEKTIGKKNLKRAEIKVKYKIVTKDNKVIRQKGIKYVRSYEKSNTR